ncbi:hypothetical protein HYALB_00008574 [Hymenoscyphus albidus]|uniref:Uncharacterized protein n=1 Tax=Hymenoscyphus albidus TaxID=595503 RepID=A0A9N9PZM1_9HELO|nr:hypothetical protein HYALB_00008574 [Hymenoscyphus albidus]
MSEYRACMIIGAVQVDRDRDQRKGLTVAAQSVTRQGTIVYEKERKSGFRNPTSREERLTYVSIREVDGGENALPAESDHLIVWSEATLEWLNCGRAWGRMSNNAVVHFTCPLRHMFTNPSQILGEVTEGSFISLRKLYLGAFSDPTDFADDKEPTDRGGRTKSRADCNFRVSTSTIAIPPFPMECGSSDSTQSSVNKHCRSH